jgi:hypothetical protein
MGESLWKRKANQTIIKREIGGFRHAPWLQSGRNMRGLIGKMSLVTTEGQVTFAEVEKGKNPVQYEREQMIAQCEEG